MFKKFAKRKNSILSLSLFVLILLFIFVCQKDLLNGSLKKSEESIKLEERIPAPAPDDWVKRSITDRVTIRIPTDWYLTNPGKSYKASPDNSYLISDLAEEYRNGYQDWNENEYLRIDFSFYNKGNSQATVESRSQEIIDYFLSKFNFRYGKGYYEPFVEFSLEHYLLNGYKITRFVLDEEEQKESTLMDALVIDLKEDGVLQAVASLRSNISEEKRTLYENRIHTLFDSIVIQ